MNEAFLYAIGLGLLGSGHCLGMCGGIVSSLSLGVVKPKPSTRIFSILLFNLGRTSSYALAGALLGLTAQGLSTSHSLIGPGLRIAAGLLLILMGLYLAGWSLWLTRIESLGSVVWRRLQPLTQSLLPVRSLHQALLLGALWGWLPCGLVYSTLAWAATQGNWQDSALLMAGFGLGTVPAMFATGLAAKQIQGWLQKKAVRGAFGALILAFGVWTILGTLPHLLGGHAGHSQHSIPANTSHSGHEQMDHDSQKHEGMNHEGMTDHQHMHHAVPMEPATPETE